MGRGGKRPGAGKPKDERTRNWLIEVYPPKSMHASLDWYKDNKVPEKDGAVENWREIINEINVPWIESPIHDKDLYPDGTLKKPHYHCILMYDGNKSYSQIKEITDSINAPIPIPCKGTVKANIEYFVHKNALEKHQYNWNDMKCHSGADIESLCLPSRAQLMKIEKEIGEFVRGNDITEFSELYYYCLDEGLDDWFYAINNQCTVSIKALLASRRHGRMKTNGCK